MNILIIRVSAIGDVIHTLPSIFLIKKLFPNAKISWIVQKKAADLLVSQDFLDKIFVLPNKYLSLKNLNQTLNIISQIKKHKWNLILDFQGLLKTSILLLFLTGKKYGFDKTNARGKFSTYFTNKRIIPNYENIIEKNLSLVTNTFFDLKKIKSCPTIQELKKDLKLNINKNFSDNVDSWLLKNKLNNFIILSPNTTWESKHWPEDNWIKLIKNLDKQQIVLLGADFGGMAANIYNCCKINNIKIYIAPKFNLLEVADLIQKSKLLIAPDTGILHLADYLQKRAIGIFGPTKAKKHGAYLHEFNIKNVIQIECLHYYQKTHNDKNIKNGSNKTNCMYKLSPESLSTKILNYLEE